RGALELDGEGPPLGEAPQPMEASDLDGRPVVVGGPGREQLLLFVSPGCPVCRDVLPSFGVAANAAGLEPIVIGAGDATGAWGLAKRTSRRSFLGLLGRGAVAVAGGSFVAAALDPQRAEAFHICGHIYTTGSCPHPYYPNTRLDHYGYAVHPEYGYPVDDDGNL